MGGGILAAAGSAGGGSWDIRQKKRQARDANRAQKESARMQNAANAANFAREQRASDFLNQTNVDALGKTGLENFDGRQLTTESADAYGGALEELAKQSQGYNPAYQMDPRLQEIGATRDALAAQKANAEKFADDSIARWEQQQRSSIDDYEKDRASMKEEALANQSKQQQFLDKEKEVRKEEQLKQLIDTWIGSNDKEAVGVLRFVREGLIKGKGGRGELRKKVDNNAKARYIQALLHQGMSYSEMLEHEPRLFESLMTDRTTGSMAKQMAMEDEQLNNIVSNFGIKYV